MIFDDADFKGATPVVNLRNPLQAKKPRWLLNPGQMSPEVQNKDTSDPTKIYVWW